MPTQLKVTSASIIHDTIEGEAVVLNLETGYYYAFNSVATVIWSLIVAGKHSEESIARIAGSQNSNFLRFLVDHEIVAPEKIEGKADSGLDELEIISGLAQWNTFSDMQDLFLLDPIHDIALSDKDWPEFRGA